MYGEMQADEVLYLWVSGVFCVYGLGSLMNGLMRSSGSHVVAWSEHAFVFKITF